MKSLSRITTIGLLALTAGVLVVNVLYIYTTPVPNSWIWWPGDETWLMAEYHQFVSTGHYVNPLAPGSLYAECSGLLFGSCYLTAAIYGLPLLFVKAHTIDIGRTVSFSFGLLTLIALWVIAKRYQVSAMLRALGCLMLASTVCFFMMSHSARSDMLVGLAVLILVGYLPLLVERSNPDRDILLGLLIPICLLVNGHALIISFPVLGYSILTGGVLKSGRMILRCVASSTIGFGCLLILQYALLGSASLVGPIGDSSAVMTFSRFLHPRAHLTNYSWRIFIANSWAPVVLWISIVLAATVLWARLRYNVRLFRIEQTQRRLLVRATLAVLSSVYLEYYWPRYFIFVLPIIVLSSIILISFFIRTLPRSSGIALSLAISACMVFALSRYWIDTERMGAAGKTITAANKAAVADALAAIHNHTTGSPRVFSTIPGQYIAMDDSCDLITPITYDWPSDRKLSRKDSWQKARINYAILCNPSSDLDVRLHNDSIIGWSATPAKLIFERVGNFSDIGRTYDTSDNKISDTLRVYEFQP